MYPIRGGFRDEQAAPECRGCCKTSGPHWRLEVSCSPPGKHQSLLSGTCHCCGPGGIHSILPGFSPRNLPANPVVLKAWVDVGIKSVSVCSGFQQPWISKGAAAQCLWTQHNSPVPSPLPGSAVCDRLMCQFSA